MNHYIAAETAIEKLKVFDGISKIVLYGSVATGRARPDSDIDIAVIVKDRKNYPANLDAPLSHLIRGEIIVEQIRAMHNLRLHLVFYWESEYAKGIVLDGSKKHREDCLLNEVGIVKFDTTDGKI